MQSISPLVVSKAGQSTHGSGNCFTFNTMATKLMDRKTAFDWLSHDALDLYRGLHHPSATGYGHAR